DEAVVLVRRVGPNAAILGRRDALRLALGERRGGLLGRRRRIEVARARIGGAVEDDTVRREQILHGRRANRAVVAAAEGDVAHRRQLRLDLVRVGRVAGATRRLIVGVAIAARDREFVQEAVAHDRDADFAEHLAHVERAGDRQRRRALAGEVAGLERDVGEEVQRFLAVLDTGGDADALARPRELKPVIAELAGDAGRSDRLAVYAALESRHLEIGERLGGHAIGREDVPGHAVRIGAARLGRTADRGTVRTGDDVEGALQAGHREVVEIGLGEVGPPILIIDIVRPGRVDVAANTRHDTIFDVLQVVATTTAFDVAAQDLQEAALIRGTGQRIGEGEGGIAGAADGRAARVAQQVVRRADDRQLLR